MRVPASEKKLNAAIVVVWVTLVLGLIVAATWFLLIKPGTALDDTAAGEGKRGANASVLQGDALTAATLRV